MTRDPDIGEDPSDQEVDGEQPTGALRSTRPGVLTGCLLAGVVVGRLVQPVSRALGWIAPRVGLPTVLALFFLAALLAGVAWLTHRTLQVSRGSLLPHQAVNRLVLAKSCAVGGAVVAGGYLGYAISWLRDDAQLSRERLTQSLLAALAAALVVLASLALERACRVRRQGS